MPPTLSSLIDEVEAHAPSPEPLDQLATASATVQEVNDLTDSLLSHFVDRCRRAGRSWAEIGSALGVTKQAVQKRFTKDRDALFSRFTPRAVNVVTTYANAAAEELGHTWIGTEHLLLALYGEPEGIGAKVLAHFGLTRDGVIAGIYSRVEGATAADADGYTPRAWVAIQNCASEAVKLGHNYVGTEHLLLSLLSGIGGMAADILKDGNVEYDAAKANVVERLTAFIAERARQQQTAEKPESK